MAVKLLVLEGVHTGREIPLPETIYLIGRDRQCHLRPHCRLVSQLHCAIAAWAGQVRVRDLKSRNGTFVNGRPVHGEVLVHDGDRLRVGSLVFAFHVCGSSINLAEPIRDPDEVDWLLDDVDDSDSLIPINQTVLVADLKTLTADTPSGSHSLSGGQHLRDYLDARQPVVKSSRAK